MDNEPVTWRKFAAETRRIAADICDESVREKYLQLAAGYDNLAQTAAARIEADTESYQLARYHSASPREALRHAAQPLTWRTCSLGSYTASSPPSPNPLRLASV